MIHDNILSTIGNTPIVRLNRLAPDHVEMFVKCEYFNPLGSVKDRLANAIVNDGLRTGALREGQTVVEATSGNTGIALAMVCAARGHPFVAVMAETFSIERRRIMKALGARVIITPKEIKATGMVEVAARLADENGWFLARQFENPANPAYHRNTTGPEIARDFADRRLDYFVSGYGTGGTITGVADVLKVARPMIEIVAVEPEPAQLLRGDEWTPHMIQGWTPNFIPDVLDRDAADTILSVTDEQARDTALALASKEGLFCGISAGGTVAGALEVARRAPKGSVLLAMLPDTGERYMSSYLFADIDEHSDEEWLKEATGRGLDGWM